MGASGLLETCLLLDDVRDGLVPAIKNRTEEDKVFSESLSDARSKLAAFRKIDGNDSWNASVAEREEYAKNFFNGGATIRQMADLALLGMDHPVQARIIAKQEATIKNLSEQVSKLTAAGSAGGSAPGYKPDESGITAEERAMRTFDKYVGK